MEQHRSLPGGHLQVCPLGGGGNSHRKCLSGKGGGGGGGGEIVICRGVRLNNVS